jgi:hypothetical protein
VLISLCVGVDTVNHICDDPHVKAISFVGVRTLPHPPLFHIYLHTYDIFSKTSFIVRPRRQIHFRPWNQKREKSPS